MDMIKWLLANWAELIVGFNAVLVALIAFFMLIPGPHPEDWLQGVANFISKFSKK